MNLKSYRILSLVVPRNIQSSPMLFESILAFLHSISEGACLEFSLFKQKIFANIHVPSKYCDSLISQLYAVYPDCIILEKSYLDEIALDSKQYMLIEFDFKNSSIYPIKRYEQFEDRLTKVVYDPINSIFQLFEELNLPRISMCLLLKPENHRFKYYATKAIYYIDKYKNFFSYNLFKRFFLSIIFSRNLIFKLFLYPFCLNAGEIIIDDVKKDHRVESTLEAVIDKINKTLFSVKFNFLISIDNSENGESIIESINSMLKTFEQANLNGFKVLKYTVGDFNLIKNFYTHSHTFFANSEEISTLFHAPGEQVNSDIFNWLNSKRLSPPKCFDGIKLGISDYRNCNADITVSEVDRLRHTYIVGKTGMGKSTLLLNLLLQDADSGSGFALIDPHGDLVDAFLSRIPKFRINDVILIEPFKSKYSVGLNLLEVTPGMDINIVVSSAVAVFKKLFGFSWGPRLEYFLRNFILALVSLKDGKTLLDLQLMLTDLDFCKRIVSEIKDPILVDFFEKEFFKLNQSQRSEFIAPILNKLGQFTLNPRIRSIVGVKQSTVDFSICMNKKQIVLFNLSKGKLGEDCSNLLGSLFISKFEIETLKRSKVDEKFRSPFFLYIDEFQNFATDSFSVILSEARKYGLGLILANQFLDQISEEIMKSIFGNVGNLLSFQIGADDAEPLSKQFFELVTPTDILLLEKFQAYGRILINGQSSSVFSFRTIMPKQPNLNFLQIVQTINKQNKLKYLKKNR